MKKFIYIILLSSMPGASAWAQSSCSTAKDYQQLVSCAVDNSPEVQSARLDVQKSRAMVQAAGQWKNPEFSGETFSGKAGNDDIRETDLAIGIPIELGGKISARKDFAQSGVSLSEAKLYQIQAKVKIETLLKLHRLRQLIHEKELTAEAIRTFTQLVGQYSKRPTLSPEQQLSKSVYGLSKSEYDLKSSSLSDEILALDTYFKNNMGLSTDQVKGFLPPSPSSWPTIPSASNNPASPLSKVLDAEVNAAKAQLSMANSEAWPTLMIGPSYKMQTEGSSSNNLMGVNLSLPLPLFNLNGGAKAAANAGVQVSETKKNLALRELGLKREELAKSYEQTVTTLRTSLSHEEIEKRHDQSEGLFLKGVAPSSLVIETHRTSYELERTRHERELKALETLLEIFTLDGTILEKNI